MKLNVKMILFFWCIIGRSLIGAQNAHQESITIRVSDGQLTIGPATFNLLKMVSQTVREQAEPMGINTLSLLELDTNDLRMILELMKISNRPTTLEEKLTQYTDLFALSKLYKQVRFLDIKSLMEGVKQRIAQLVATERDTKKLKDFLSYLGTQNTDRSLIDLIKKKIADTITVVLKDNSSSITDRSLIDQLASESKVIKEELTAMRRNQLTLPELTLTQWNKIVTLFSLYQLPKLISVYLSQQSFEQLVDLLTGVSFLELDLLKSLLEQSLAKKVIAQKKDNRKDFLYEIERAVGKNKSYQNIEMITDNLKPGMYNFVLKDGLVTKPLSDKKQIDALIEASQTLKDLTEDTGKKDIIIFYLQQVSKKTFENLYSLIPYLVYTRLLAAALGDPTSFGLLPIALLLQAANFLGIEKLIDATLNELAKRLLTNESLKLFQNGRQWDTFMGLSKDLDMIVTKRVVQLLEIPHFFFLKTLAGHNKFVSSVTWSPDSKYLASGSWDSTVKIWNASNGQLLNTLKEDNNSVESVTWSPDGKYLATGLDNDTTEIWDTAKWKRLKTLKGHTDSVDSVAWSPNAKYLATGSSDDTAKIWNTSNWQLLHTLSGHSNGVKSVAWSPDGKYLATGSYDTSAKIWDALNRNLIKTLQGHTGRVYSVAWGPDGKYLATGSSDKTAKIWNTSNWQVIHTLAADAPVAWSSDGKYLATGSSDTTARIWSTSSWKLASMIEEHTDTINSVAWSPDSTYLATASADKTAKIWGILRESDLKNLTLNQALLIALASEEKRNGRSLQLNKHLKQIYDTLTPTLKELLKNVFKVMGI